MNASHLLLDDPARRLRVLLAGGVTIVAIAFVDWKVKPNLSLGFLYVVPILFLAVFVRWLHLFAVCGACALLREVLSPLPWDAGAAGRTLTAFVSFAGAGFLVNELARNRQRAVEHAALLQEQIDRRHEAEEELRVLVESSPAAIVTADASGRILQANAAAVRLLASERAPLVGSPLAACLPALGSVLDRPGPQFRTNLECMGRRGDGGLFLAHVWFSTYGTLSGMRLAAIVLDASEQFRDREASGLDSMADTSRVLFGAVSHEVRNLSAAAAVAHANLGRTALALTGNEDFRALGALVEGLQRIASCELRLSSRPAPGNVDLNTVLDQLRIVIEPSFREAGVAIDMEMPARLPQVVGEPHGLLQIFLNLAWNSFRAMQSSPERRLVVAASANGEGVSVRFSDTGRGVSVPERLFRPFQPGSRGTELGEATGLGLFVSRTIARSFAGDLLYEPRSQGSCFVLRLVSTNPRP
jgi:signal transduction histidine kinase